MIAGGIATSNEVEDLLPGIETLRSAGAESVVVTRAADPALAWVDGTLYEIKAPSLAANEFRGSGDSFTAGLAVGIARNSKPEEMFQVAASAGALNVTRHGLGTGQRDDIMKFAQYVTVNLLEEASKKKKGS
jgi:1-phosphofructokinase